MLQDDDSSVKAAAWSAVLSRYLGRNGTMEPLERVITGAASQGSEKAALEAVRALRQYCTHPAQLTGALEHPSAAVRGAAVDALPDVARRSDDPVDVDALLARLADDPEDAVRKKVIKARAALP